MALGEGIGQPPRTSSADINVIPLVDVILVLLVIFIVTAPLIAQAVKVNLPQARSQPLPGPAAPVVAIDAGGRLHWDGRPLSLAELEEQARALAARPDAELHIEADRAVAYDAVAQVLSAAARAGVARIGFITDPGPAAGEEWRRPGVP